MIIMPKKHKQQAICKPHNVKWNNSLHYHQCHDVQSCPQRSENNGVTKTVTRNCLYNGLRHILDVYAFKSNEISVTVRVRTWIDDVRYNRWNTYFMGKRALQLAVRWAA